MIKPVIRFLQQKSNYFLIGTSSTVIILIFIIDLAFLTREIIPTHIYWLRETLIVAVFLLALSLLFKRHNKQEQHIVYKLKTAFFAALGLYISVAFSKMIISSENETTTESTLNLFGLLQKDFRATFTAVFVTLFLIVLLFLIRDLVHYKSKAKTYKLFRFGLFLFVVYVIYRHYTIKMFRTEWSLQGQTPLEWVFFGLLLLIIFLLSFRTSWVTYLNKRQKYAACWAGLFLIPGAIFVYQSNIFQEINRYSFTLGSFNSFTFYFICSYLVLAELNLLLHLPTASIFEKKIREIESLQNLSRDISSVLSYDELISKVTTLTHDVLNPDASWLEMKKKNGELSVVSYHNLTNKELSNMHLKNNEGLSGWIFENKESILVNDVSKDSRSKYILNYQNNIGSILGVPLTSKDGVMGILYATKEEEYGFEQDDREMLQAFANQASVAIENSRLIEQSIEKERLEQELMVARNTQMKLLPKEMPKKGSLDIDAHCLMAAEVGGDYFDFIDLDEDRLGVVIADVSGKGLSAAFYMAELKGIVSAYASLYHSPRILLEKVNKTLYETLDQKTFVTMIYAIFDLKKKKVTISRAGHGPFIHFSSKKKQSLFLQPHGIGVALDSGTVFNKILDEIEIGWHKNDFFLFFTDGLDEARNSKLEEYGLERLTKVLNETYDMPAEEILNRIIDDVSKFTKNAKKHDDLSMIVVKVDS